MSNKKGWPKKLEVIYDKSGSNHPLDQKLVKYTAFLNSPLVTADFFTRNDKINLYSVQEIKINTEILNEDQVKMFFERVQKWRKEVADAKAAKKTEA